MEAIDAAVQDARENALINGIDHAQFFSGDVIDVCNDAFFQTHGRPDVIITDPPRAGMHQKLVEKISSIAAEKNCTPSQLALAWVMAQGEHIFPIPGTKRIKYLEENIGALNITFNRKGSKADAKAAKKV